MTKERGFTLIELLIVVAIIGIIAAIAIPSLLRARVSANESAAIGDTRTVISAQAAYQSAASGFYGEIGCLNAPNTCITGYPTTAPTFLDSNITALTTKQGYNRSHEGLTAASVPAGLTNALDTFCYGASPAVPNKTGVRSFGGDSSGVVGSQVTAGECCDYGQGSLVVACPALR